MRITFFSNFFNVHQLPLALEFYAMEQVDYTFISLLATDGIVGRSSLDGKYDFVLKEYESEKSSELAMQHALEDEIVVFGDMAGKEGYVRARAKTGKPFFRYAERILKRGDWWRFVPPKICRTWNRFGRYRNSNMRVLCAGAYTARDLSMFGFPVKKCLKWGYFPQTQGGHGNDNSKLSLPRYKALCSAQRLIPWKRVELQLHALKRVKGDGFDATLTIAGDGPERQKLEDLAGELELSDCVTFVGELSHKETLALMSRCGIFLATSDRNEGWGATINEAMGMGCCVIASEEMGSVPFLIDDGFNGLSFRCDDVPAASEKIEQALSDADLIRRLGDRAKKTVDGIWSAERSASRLAELASAVLSEETASLDDIQPWPDGPLSSAGI